MRYLAPSRVDLDRDNKLYLRTLIVKNGASLEVKVNNRVVKTRKLAHIQPSEMITVELGPKDLESAAGLPDPTVEVAIV